MLSFKVGIVALSKGHLEEKYRCKYRTGGTGRGDYWGAEESWSHRPKGTAAVWSWGRSTREVGHLNAST